MRRKIVPIVFVLLSFVLACAQSRTATNAQSAANAHSADPQIVRYHATIDTVKYVYGAAPAVARLKPGNILEANSLDCFGNALQKPGSWLAVVKGDSPLTGRFFIEGAEPGDTLVVRILDLQVDSNQGVGTFSPGFGAANSTHYTPVLESKPLPEKMWFYPIDREKNTATFQALDSSFKEKFPLHPFLASIGVCPAHSAGTMELRASPFAGQTPMQPRNGCSGNVTFELEASD